MPSKIIKDEFSLEISRAIERLNFPKEKFKDLIKELEHTKSIVKFRERHPELSIGHIALLLHIKWEIFMSGIE